VFNISPQNVVKIRDKTRKLYNLLTTPWPSMRIEKFLFWNSFGAGSLQTST
jgi:hypothetical protein